MKPLVVSHKDWLAARTALLAEEKSVTRARDEVARKRRELPWEKVDKDYIFESSTGPVKLADLFQSRSQLFLYHFMLAPDWENPCEGCSFIADHVDAARQHFEHADLSFAAVSRAGVEKIAHVKKRMGWDFQWVSSGENPFNYDYGVSFTREQLASGKVTYNYAEIDNSENQDLHGCSIFAKGEDGEIYHTYSCYARGAEILLGAFNFLDFTPNGRAEEDGIMCWVRRHDEYENNPKKSSCCGS
ncbi:MAG: thioredoxin family protein [Verrucomicrobiota bacterium]